jgi:hypothetical protein
MECLGRTRLLRRLPEVTEMSESALPASRFFLLIFHKGNVLFDSTAW